MTSSNSNSNSSLTLKYGVEGNWAGHTKNTIDVRLIGPGVDHFAQYPVNAANEDALVRSVNRLIYIETTPWHQCKDQLGFWKRAIHIDAVDSADHFAVRHGLSSGSTARVPGQERGPGGLCGRSAGRGLATMSR